MERFRISHSPYYPRIGALLFVALFGLPGCSIERPIDAPLPVRVHPDACPPNAMPIVKQVGSLDDGTETFTINPLARCQPEAVPVYGSNPTVPVAHIRPGDVFAIECKTRHSSLKVIADDVSGEVRNFTPSAPHALWQARDAISNSIAPTCAN